MNVGNQTTVNEIRAATCARYAAITPQGIRLPAASHPYNPLSVTLVCAKPARTRYIDKKPLCRSLNGITSINGNNHCIACDYRRTCTPQIALDFLYRMVPFRLMLAYTSAKNFLDFMRIHCITNMQINGVTANVSVINRGHWGEVRFDIAR